MPEELNGRKTTFEKLIVISGEFLTGARVGGIWMSPLCAGLILRLEKEESPGYCYRGLTRKVHSTAEKHKLSFLLYDVFEICNHPASLLLIFRLHCNLLTEFPAFFLKFVCCLGVHC